MPTFTKYLAKQHQQQKQQQLEHQERREELWTAESRTRRRGWPRQTSDHVVSQAAKLQKAAAAEA